MTAASSWIGSLTGGGRHAVTTETKKTPACRVNALLSKLPDVFTGNDVMKFYAPATTFRYTKLMVELGLVEREYKNLPTNGLYCLYKKLH